MDLSVVIVSFNVRNYLLNCIRSVQKATGPYSVEIIVVDNASEDSSVQSVRETFPDVKLISNLVNAGFGSACNQGAEAATGTYLLFLNPDTLVGESVFTELIPFMEKTPDAGLTGCRILNEDGTLQLACRRSFPTPWVAFTRLTGLSSLFPKSPLFAKYNLTYLDEHSLHSVDAVSGSFMLMPRKVFELTGGFDETFFMYGEDLDLCYRVKEAGYKVYYQPSASIVHFKGRSKSDRVDTRYFFYESMRIFSRKHGKSASVWDFFLNSAISARYLFSRISHLSGPFFSFLTDFAVTAAAFELISFFRFGRMFYYPAESYPIIYLFIFFVQAAVYNWFGVYSGRTKVKRRLIAAAGLTWIFLSLAAFFSVDFAFSRIVMLISILTIPFLQIAWRFLIDLKRGGQIQRKAMLVTGNSSFWLTAWFRLWIDWIQQMNLTGIIKKDENEAAPWTDLPIYFKPGQLTDLILDTDSLTYREQVQLIQLCREHKLRPHLIPESSLKEMILNDILTREEKTGGFNRMAKRFTDWLISLETGLQKTNKPGVFLTGARISGKRTPAYPGGISIQAEFPELTTEDDQQLLTLFYNRFHTYHLDRKLAKNSLERQRQEKGRHG